MAYIIAAAILALLVIGFTRRTIVLLAVLVTLAFASVGLYLLQDTLRQREVAARNAALLTSVEIDPACGAETPLRITLRNTAALRLDAVTFDIAGYREGHSIPLYRTRGYLSDRILDPGEVWSGCHPLPEPIRGTDTSALATHPPETLRWSAENVAGRFAAR